MFCFLLRFGTRLLYLPSNRYFRKKIDFNSAKNNHSDTMAAKEMSDQLLSLALADGEEGGANHLDKLPDKLLLRIMLELSPYDAFDLIKFGCTCRRLRRLSMHPSLWEEVRLRYGFNIWLVAPRLHYGTRILDLGEREYDYDAVRKGGSKKVGLV